LKHNDGKLFSKQLEDGVQTNPLISKSIFNHLVQAQNPEQILR